MNRADRRRYDREMKSLLAKDSDNCTICRKPFAHASRTFYGVSDSGRTVIVSRCCQARLSNVLGEGIFVDKGFGDMFEAAAAKADNTPYAAPTSAAEVREAVDRLEAAVHSTDGMGTEMLQRAGLDGWAKITLLPTAWKKDDADWFAVRPLRSHRLRAPFDGELDTLGGPPDDVPLGHSIVVLVRQIEPGKRVRIMFGLDDLSPVPDIEELIHALFDLAANAEKGQPISRAALKILADKYSSVGASKTQ